MRFTPEDFPSLLLARQSSTRGLAAFRDAVQVLDDALTAGSIRKPVYDEIKTVLGRTVESAWDQQISGPFFHAGRWETQPPAIQEFYHSTLVTNLHDAGNAKRKFERIKGADGPVAQAIHSFLQEVAPLIDGVNELKDKLVKGRAVSTEESSKPENPDKIVRTCACCFRGIALAGNTMAHHGYTRPGDGQQTSSCPGINFRPLEVSSEGLEWRLKLEREQLERLQKAYDHRHEVQTLLHRRTAKDIVKIGRDDPMWPRLFRNYEANLETDIRFTSRTVTELQQRFDAWQPTETEDLRSLPRKRRQP